MIVTHSTDNLKKFKDTITAVGIPQKAQKEKERLTRSLLGVLDTNIQATK